jgi:hypothetical protein
MAHTSKYDLMGKKPNPPRKTIWSAWTQKRLNRKKSRQKTNSNQLDKKLVNKNNKASDCIQDNRWREIRLLPN